MMNKRRLLAASAIGLAGLVTPLTAIGSYAHAAPCRSDPVVWLSNGHKIQLSSQVSADPSAVSAVNYTLDVPTGVWVIKTVYTQGPIGRREHIDVDADNTSPSAYTATAIVVSDSTVPDTSSMAIVNGWNDWNVTLTQQATTNETATFAEWNAQ